MVETNAALATNATSAFAFMMAAHFHIDPFDVRLETIARFLDLAKEHKACFGCETTNIVKPGDLALLSFVRPNGDIHLVDLLVCALCQDEDSEGFMLSRAEHERGVRIDGPPISCDLCDHEAEAFKFLYYRTLPPEAFAWDPQAKPQGDEHKEVRVKVVEGEDWSKARWIVSRFNGFCALCASPLPKGSKCLWNRGNGVLCQNCGALKKAT